MKVLGMGMPELLIILAVALLIFGPKHLPKLGAAIGSTVKNLRDGLGSNDKKEDEEIIEEMVEDEEVEPAPRKKVKAIEGETETVKKTTKKKKAKKETA